jgi:L-seryl-tRNA(Ser) seleniumtransferase
MPDLSKLPSIDHLIKANALQPILEKVGRPLTLDALRAVLKEIRQSAQKEGKAIPGEKQIIRIVREKIDSWLMPTLHPVINAAGVVLHTNLGRAPLSHDTLRAINDVAGQYNNLEFDLTTGKRGHRSIHASQTLARVTGAEAGFMVNNNAGAVLLTLSALAAGKNALVSRTQLIEIGGGFRIPDVMRQSGANLIEIGTTNRVHLYDFENALEASEIALILIAHHSNFKLIGFHSEPSLADIVSIAHRYRVPVLHDVGSGALRNTEDYGLAHEPMVQESIQAGCDLVCFSGDKLLGGPQAGIIVGKESLLKSIRTHPLARALRAGKLTLVGVTANLEHYLKNEAETKIPIWRMIARPLVDIKQSTENWREYLGTGEVVPGYSTVGGGSLPTEEMPTFLFVLTPNSPDQFLKQLRESQPTIIARIENDRVLFDPRTVFPEQEGVLLRKLREILEG